MHLAGYLHLTVVPVRRLLTTIYYHLLSLIITHHHLIAKIAYSLRCLLLSDSRSSNTATNTCHLIGTADFGSVVAACVINAFHYCAMFFLGEECGATDLGSCVPCKYGHARRSNLGCVGLGATDADTVV